ncbi:hypothetical protein H9L10_03690 [Phycicoccus endophyticus]|uniref:Uncharacterized protein n=1 Tax=Phycicoccus endophyticus TaxID=1690220 RepID=A0A7G9R3J6_9MICO|nr:hypothetical protein [Phycicoccus endophyticus]NHI19928.1 hypothetical protein [Phycicoccus endophyticus]QNN50171.1 hypothetical protein H9L10_03690 [Phycicoccus endophyticus]GGL27464.1 hypothetical protein GCM10012283_07050 [Phycicoccus endophyticus]
MPTTVTPERAREVAATEFVMLAYWRTCLEVGRDSGLVAGMIAAAVDFEPLLGLGRSLTPCEGPGCDLYSTDTYCSPACADAAQTAWEGREEHLQAAYSAGTGRAGAEPRPSLWIGGPR